ncbi:hypothetical protein RHO12_06085 [Orbus sturtevantii]|uniref:hypothetical protein n=1 Tax=Orbus sturtevantii TaxID=3074109 RepID=UPI00370DC3C4
MTKTYDELNNQIGQLIFKSSPDGAKKVIAQLEFTSEMDVCTFLFDFYNQNDELNWYLPDSDITSPLSDTVKELRQYCINNNLTNGLPAWIGCVITLDIEKSKINIDFKYEPFIEE